ncbi:DNA translocase FtsK [Nordella sp. HKS 07]|uniref:DNA translocase FtsK n=1 Tax=Nordella sp. HKS 07 TaxID=2712222 RepID=UPI0019D04A8A|nr:DNA translocase FtsK [Nordella sp. HKS 07]
MAIEQPIDTDDGAVPAAIRRFLRNRLMEFIGFLSFALCVAVGVALATWSPADPSFSRAIDGEPRNLLGYPGAVISDQLMQLFGLGVIAVMALPLLWSMRLMTHHPVIRPVRSVFAWILFVICFSAFLAMMPAPQAFALEAGFGGQTGEVLKSALLAVLNLGFKGFFASLVAAALFGAGAVLTGAKAVGLTRSDGALSAAIGYYIRCGVHSLWGLLRNLYQRWRMHRELKAQDKAFQARQAAASAPARKSQARVEPRLDGAGKTRRKVDDRQDNPPWLKLPAAEAEEDIDIELEEEQAAGEPIDEEVEDDMDEAPVAASRRVSPRADPVIKQAKPGKKQRAASDYELPALTLLAEPKKNTRAVDLSPEVLEQNARALEGVLEDFGVRGQIVNVRPGPVVTLYELEPAPGIKSSRVISLADDIARSMSAISARVAVVSGRNAIGIELPNPKRETVYLRELLGSEAFEKTNQNLAMALGKNIGGEPVFADLARMPHLLIAGTTGSGKSVGINTMILSLLYRHTPDRCKLIMIDPKMLELSVYEGIPHLLAPVVTDPRKAVVALKWAVREMEDRYRKMSKVGVRNIDGFNARLEQAREKGEAMSRTVQTGFDPETGEPIFEREEMDMSAMPYIVVIIDEMADLMMVAGKDIEGAVQRLAQMARAAGIHVVMATQRPSVDVITGTIKANFPTRISFQVTSKIDSRTILGEQGAEQLLGQGDMLYMAGGGRISRLHGPFVSDDEVEKIVRSLKRQGAPEYIEAITEEPEEGAYGEPGASGGSGEGSGSGDDLYDQAVAVVLRDKKVSTSYIQRRLQIGYNKAASLIERMEKEGLISAANATGKREILVPGDSARA